MATLTSQDTRYLAHGAAMVRALEGEQMPDGCVRGCPVRKSSDYSHNLRCEQVRHALNDAKGSQ